jgi:hypothetical protein
MVVVVEGKEWFGRECWGPWPHARRVFVADLREAWRVSLHSARVGRSWPLTRQQLEPTPPLVWWVTTTHKQVDEVLHSTIVILLESKKI